MKLLGVEAARGIAATMVVTLHATAFLADPKLYGRDAFGGFLLFGRAGVDFFFVLSGFIIAFIHAGDLGRPAAFGLFWRKRLLRIYPTYWVVLALFGALLAFSPTPDRAEREPWHILASILLLPEQRAYPIVGVAWSLRHEMLFYGLFSLAILHRRLGGAVLAAWFGLILFNLSWATATGRPYFTGIADNLLFRVFNMQFLFGIAVAALLRRGPAPWPRATLVAGAALFLLNGMCESFLPQVQHEWPPRHMLYALGSALAIYGLATLDQARRSRVPRALLVLGGASYSVYLVHGTALLLMQQVLRRATPFLDLPLEVAYLMVVTIAVLLGILFSRVVERPLMRAGNRLFVTERTRHGQQLQPAGQLDHGGVRRRPGGHAGQDAALVQGGAESGPVQAQANDGADPMSMGAGVMPGSALPSGAVPSNVGPGGRRPGQTAGAAE